MKNYAQTRVLSSLGAGAAKMGRPAAAHAAWPQRRGGGLSLVTGRPRDLARVWKASSALPRRIRVQYSFLRMPIYSFLLQHNRCCRRRHQRHGRIQERSGPEIYTVSCATSSMPPLLRAPSSHRVGFGRCQLCRARKFHASRSAAFICHFKVILDDNYSYRPK